MAAVGSGLAVELPGRVEQRRNLRRTVEVTAPRPRDLQAPPPTRGGVPVDMPVLDGDLEDLREPRDRLVNRLVRQRTVLDFLLARDPGPQSLRLAHLVSAVAVDLSHRDLRQAMTSEVGQQVVR